MAACVWTCLRLLLFQPLMNLCLKISGAGLVFVFPWRYRCFLSGCMDTALSGLFGWLLTRAGRWFLRGHVVSPSVRRLSQHNVSDAKFIIGMQRLRQFRDLSYHGQLLAVASAAPGGGLILDVGGRFATVAVFLSGFVTYVSAQSVWQGLSRHAAFVLQWAAWTQAVVGILNSGVCDHPIGTSSLVSWWYVVLWA